VVRAMASASFASLVPSIGLAAARDEGTSSGIPDGVLESVRERIRQGLIHGESTGLAVAVVSGNQIVWEEGFGWADRETRQRVTPHSPFSLQSVTKPFTTTLLTTFAAEGKLSLDQPANIYLGVSKIQGPNGNPEKVTVRLLGAHASGLPETYEELYDGVPSPAPATFLSNYGKLAYPPGEIWEYSNVAFDALGAIVANLTGADYGKLMSQRVLTPLGLRDSFWDTDTARIAEGVARYDAAGKKIPFYLTTTPPSGELFASAHDVARFAMWNMKIRLSDGSLLMNDHWIDELQKPAFVGPSGATSTFGWALDRLKSGKTVIHKGGGGAGVSTIVCMVPEQKLACVVLANHQHAEKFTHSICNQIFGSYLSDWTMPGENGEPPRRPFIMTDSMAGLWRGTLMNNGVTLPVQLDIRSSEVATLAVGSHAPEKLSHLGSEGPAFLGIAPGVIASPEALRVGAKLLRVKVIQREDKLVGRITSQFGALDDPHATLPFVVSLSRA
jgi:CubicO group peptidase (beta-lactamase class C family)